MRKNYDNEIIELYNSGFSNAKIALQLNINRDTVSSKLKKLGLASCVRKSINIINEFEAICKKCKLIKSIDNFQLCKKGTSKEYRLASCIDCRKEQERKNHVLRNNTLEKYIHHRYKELIRRTNRENLFCSITEAEFINQFNLQNGLCFYTDEPMICEINTINRRNILSIDKVIPDKGYVYGNFVFCLYKINTCKNDLTLEEIQKWMPSWYERIEKFLNGFKI